MNKRHQNKLITAPGADLSALTKVVIGYKAPNIEIIDIELGQNIFGSPGGGFGPDPNDPIVP